MDIQWMPVSIGLSIWILTFQVLSERALGQDGAVLPPPESLLPISGFAVLPALSDRDLAALLVEAQSQADSWLGQASVDKIRYPAPLSADLPAYRQLWAEVDPAIAPFLGFWQDGEDFPYAVSIFPSQNRNEVCVLEFRPEWNYPLWSEVVGAYIGKEVLLDQILSFSVARVEDGQLLSETVQTAAGAIFGQADTDAQFMGVQDEEGTVHIVAATSLPTLPENLPAEMSTQVINALTHYGCTVESPNSP